MNLARYHLYENAKTKNITVRLKPPPRAKRTGGWSGDLNPAASRVSNRCTIRASRDCNCDGSSVFDMEKVECPVAVKEVLWQLNTDFVVENAWLLLISKNRIAAKQFILMSLSWSNESIETAMETILEMNYTNCIWCTSSSWKKLVFFTV